MQFGTYELTLLSSCTQLALTGTSIVHNLVLRCVRIFYI